MATVSDSRTLDCSICFKTFTTPRVLPCSHTFCEKCIISNVESQQQGDSKFICPFCTTPTQTKLAIDKWARDLPLNNLICSILESGEVGKSHGDSDCDPCKADGETNKAEVWCKDCQEKICSLCRKLNNRNKLLKHHTTVPIEEIDQHLQYNINFDQECGRHREKIKMFCVDHRELCCAMCAATEHRQCNDVRIIEDIACDQSQRSASDYPSIIQDIGKLKTEMRKIISEKNNNAKEVLQEKDQIIHDMDNRLDGIIERLDQLRYIFKRETDQLHKDVESLILANEKTVKNFIKNIENCYEILVVVERSGTPQHKIMTFENTWHQIVSHYHKLKSELSENVVVHFTVEASAILNGLEAPLNSVGTVEKSTDSSTGTRDVLLDTDKILKNLDSSTKESAKMCATEAEEQDLMTSQVTLVKAVTKQRLGKGMFLTGSTYTAYGHLVTADYDNDRLVELDDEYNVVMEYKIDGQPTDVAAGNKDNEIYVAVNRNYIYKCTLQTDLTIVSRIKAPLGTLGIAFSGDNIIVGTHDAVVILTQDGSTMKSIPKSGIYNSYVAVSQTQRTIYHKDNDDLVCRTWEGQELFRYQNQQLKDPRGIDIDSDRNVYICGSHNLQQTSSDGQRSRNIQLHNIACPFSVVFHPQKSELFVTSCREDTVFEVYRLDWK